VHARRVGTDVDGEKRSVVEDSNRHISGSEFDDGELQRLIPLALLDLARRRIPAHLLPSRLHVWGAGRLPTTASGKVDRRAVRDAVVRATASDSADSVGPVVTDVGRALSPLEHVIATVWAGVLGVPVGSLHSTSSLYELGADSLGALRVSRKLVELFCGEMDHTTLDSRVGVIRGVFSPTSVLGTPTLAAYAQIAAVHPAVRAYLDAQSPSEGAHADGGRDSGGDDANVIHSNTAGPPSGANTEAVAPRTDVESAVLHAVWSHSNSLLCALLDASADVNGGVTRGRFGVTPLHAAAQADNVAAARLLVDRSARSTATMRRHVIATHVAAAKSVGVLKVRRAPPTFAIG
jgi:hypothetical protein